MVVRLPDCHTCDRLTGEVLVPTFPSAEWIEEFCRELEAHPRSAHVVAELGGVYRFIIEPGGPLTERRQYDVALSASDGTAMVRRVDNSERLRVTVRTDYPRWQQLLRGELDLAPAMLFGRVRISGDLAALLNARDDVGVVVDALRAVDTTWVDA
jgi:hypothetical protein